MRWLYFVVDLINSMLNVLVYFSINLVKVFFYKFDMWQNDDLYFLTEKIDRVTRSNPIITEILEDMPNCYY